MASGFPTGLTVKAGRCIARANGDEILTVQRVESPNGCSNISAVEADDLTHLFAAAPDLLAALKDCLEARKWLRLAKGEPIGRAVVVEDVFARAAEIGAKAEGREP